MGDFLIKESDYLHLFSLSVSKWLPYYPVSQEVGGGGTLFKMVHSDDVGTASSSCREETKLPSLVGL